MIYLFIRCCLWPISTAWTHAAISHQNQPTILAVRPSVRWTVGFMQFGVERVTARPRHSPVNRDEPDLSPRTERGRSAAPCGAAPRRAARSVRLAGLVNALSIKSTTLRLASLVDNNGDFSSVRPRRPPCTAGSGLTAPCTAETCPVWS